MSPEDKLLFDKMIALEGKDLTQLTEQEKAVFDEFEARAHEFGVTIEVATEAPIADVKQYTSPYETNQMKQHFPNQIIIKRAVD
ncbi:hypothetical protein DZ860_11140 [Vibrio sinensis]|uniref:Uncharacterized protein n=1 Tax=Vibrio sinensis TaxID=2302434 RepID=A0A3A6QLM3_9VIBR|nr:hypothetical protein [Vibrio sinensis]RJX71483.1 hypothetical protein DZ860_11140 [Vibrio sinensis]